MKIGPTQLDILEYAEEGVRTLIGTHPQPNEDAEYIAQLGCDLIIIRARIKKLKEKQREDH